MPTRDPALPHRVQSKRRECNVPLERSFLGRNFVGLQTMNVKEEPAHEQVQQRFSSE
jgi:hypothetical protein